MLIAVSASWLTLLDFEQLAAVIIIINGMYKGIYGQVGVVGPVVGEVG